MIHKIGNYPRMLCGENGGKFSNVGALALINCPKCRELMRPKTREEQLAMLQKQIEETYTRKAMEGAIL